MTGPLKEKEHAWDIARFALIAAGVFGIINVLLLVHYEVTNGKHGDGFMLILPVFSWIFLVVPICLLASVFTVVNFFKKKEPTGWKQLVRNFSIIAFALIVQPALVFYTITNHV